MDAIQEYIQTKLNDEQFKAAMHIDTASLIIAGAGSGKTRTLTYKIAYLIFGKKVNPQQILAVTFTNKAANEMKERLVQLGKDMAHLSNQTDTTSESDDIMGFLDEIESSSSNYNGLSATDLNWIGTFHSIFLKILKEDIENAKPVLDKHFPNNKYNSKFTILDSNDSSAIIKDILKKTGLKDTFKPNECKGFISKQKNLGVTPDGFHANIGLASSYDGSMAKIYHEYQNALALSNALDFDDLLMLPFLIFKGDEEILQKWMNKFSYIMVDEAQDTNWIQFELMKMLSAGHKNITLIGDDYQSIYGRRGAIMENFLNVKKYRPEIQIFKLQINYRSRPHIVNAGSHIIKNNTQQYSKEIKAHRTGDDKIIVFTHRDEMDEAMNVIDLIKKMKDEGKLKKRSEVAILYRTNAQSSPFEQILVQEGIPYKIRGAFKFFERKEIKDIVSYITYILNPQSNVSLKRIINIPSRKIGKTSIAKLEDYAIINNMTLNEVMKDHEKLGIKLPPLAKKGIANFYEVIEAVTSKLDSLSPSDVIETLVKKMKYKDYLVKEEGSESKAEERYENIGQLINMASGKYDGTGEDTLRLFMEEVALLTDIANEKEGDIDAIKLMSLHSSKGLEFPLVFIVGVEDQVLPLSGSLMEPHLLEEERRLMYVGITRAENHLFLSYAQSRMQRGQTKMNPPSRFISEIPDDLLKRYDLSGGGSSSSQEPNYGIEAGDIVSHKLFGSGYVLETWTNLAIVKRNNAKFGVRKVEMRYLTKTSSTNF